MSRPLSTPSPNNFEQAKHFFLLGLENINKELFEEAERFLCLSLDLLPDRLSTLTNLSAVLIKLDKLEKANEIISKAIALYPDNENIYFNQGQLFENNKNWHLALASYGKAIGLKFDYAEAHMSRGIVLNEMKRFEEALVSLDQAIEIKPDLAVAHNNRGIVLKELKRFDQALQSYDSAIEFKHDYAEAYSNRGIALVELKRFDEALACYEQAIELKPDFADAYWNKSVLLLSLQDFENGWLLYEWRWKCKHLGYSAMVTGKPKLTQLKSDTRYEKKILVWAEQGVGDQVLYAGMFDQLLKMAPSSQIMLDKRLTPLLKRSLPQGTFIESALESEYDEHLPIADLGKYFRTCRADFDGLKNNYLVADKTRANKIRNSLIGHNKFLCGINWSSKTEKIGVEKSMQLDDLLPLLGLKDIAFVSLQYGDVQQQLQVFNEKHAVDILECTSVDNFDDLDGHAALIEACDFVVSISNTSAHIAGAIGKETYLMCPTGKGLLWYWSNQSNGKSLWYPSIHIHEQHSMGQWDDVVEKIKLIIEKKINEIK